ncbi:transposase, partial [Megasphaera sp. BL7]
RINQYWNKRKARLQSIAAKQGRKTTNQLCQLAKKRNFRMHGHPSQDSPLYPRFLHQSSDRDYRLWL